MWSSKTSKEFKTPEKAAYKSASPQHVFTAEKQEARPTSIRRKIAARALELLVLEGESASLKEKQPTHSKFRFRSKFAGRVGAHSIETGEHKLKDLRDMDYNLSSEVSMEAK